MFKLQWTELINKRKEVEREHDAKIADLKRKLCDAQAAKENALNAINKEFLPAGSFPEPYFADFNAECWRMYLDDCTTQGGVRPVECNDVGMSFAIVTYGYIVWKRRVVSHLEEKDNLMELTRWVNRKFGYFCGNKEAASAAAAGVGGLGIGGPVQYQVGLVQDNAPRHSARGRGKRKLDR